MNNQSFWDWFSSIEEDLFHHVEEHPETYASEIHFQLTEVHPDIVFDIPFETVEGRREFIISADGDASLFPVIEELCSEAPDYDRWIIHALRPRTNQRDQAIDLDGLYLEYEDIFYRVDHHELPLQLTIYIRGYDTVDNRYIHGYFLLLDTLLGEYDAVIYTETIAIYPYDEQTDVSRFVTLRELFDSLQEKKN
jgi:hypothetical protein